jgi:hypothetical protein
MFHRRKSNSGGTSGNSTTPNGRIKPELKPFQEVLAGLISATGIGIFSCKINNKQVAHPVHPVIIHPQFPQPNPFNQVHPAFSIGFPDQWINRISWLNLKLKSAT